MAEQQPGDGHWELDEWWPATAAEDLSGYQVKAALYGAHDLQIIGVGMNPDLAIDPPRAIEAGIAFYALGKAARAIEACRDGRRPSRDTWVDLTVYAMMARRVRETGGLR